MEHFDGDVGAWARDEQDRYTRAKETLRALIAAYSARIVDDDPATVQELRAARTRHAEQLRALAADDLDEIERILSDYPALITRVRTGE